MSDPRYVIVDLADYSMMMPAKRTNLPDAEHIHITRHPDGTWTAVPMQQARRRDHHGGCVVDFGWPCSCNAAPSWVDSPGEETGGAA